MPQYIDIHTHNCCKKEAIVSYRLGVDTINENVCDFTVGIHPWDIDKGIDIAEIVPYLDSPKIVGIGEVGLDFYRAKSDEEKAFQRQIFIEHIKIANENNLPLIIHSVKANNETFSILKNNNKNSEVIFHSFIGSLQEAQQLINEGYYISLSPNALKSQKTMTAFENMPLNRIFCETDDSEHNISDVYHVLSMLRDENIELIKTELYNSYKKIFKNE
ncbi:MAG: TatD family hydrolase [Rikenellaceae bacterium]